MIDISIAEAVRAVGARRYGSGIFDYRASCPICRDGSDALRIERWESGCIALKCQINRHTEPELIDALALEGRWPGHEKPKPPPQPEPRPKSNVVNLFDAAPEPAGDALFDAAEASVGAMLDAEPPERRYLLEGLLPLGVVGMLAAAGGTGKSMLVLQLAVAVSSGQPFLGVPVREPGGALVLAAEDEREELHRRLWRIAQGLRERGELGEAAEELLRERLFLVSRVGSDNRITRESYGETVRTGMVRRLTAALDELPPIKLIVLDPISRFRSGEENNNDSATRFVEVVEELRAATGATVLLPHHLSKEGLRGGTERLGPESLRGASGLIDGVRWAAAMATMRRDAAQKYKVEPDRAGRYVRLDVLKNNYAAPWAGMWLERGAHGILAPASLDAPAPEMPDAQYRKLLQRARAIIVREGPISYRRFRDYAGKDRELATNEKAAIRAIKRAVADGHLVERCGKRGSVICIPEWSESSRPKKSGENDFFPADT